MLLFNPVRGQKRLSPLFVYLPAVLGYLTLAPVMAGPVFIGLGDLPGGLFSSRARAVSADGTTVVGSSSSANGSEAFRWSLGSGMVGLGDLSGGLFRSAAYDVSADGTVIVGFGDGEWLRAVRWTSENGIESLGTHTRTAQAVSNDGSVIVGGLSTVQGSEAFRWTEESGPVGLGDLPGGGVGSEAHDVSADGRVVVGLGQTGGSEAEAFRWSAETDLIGMGFLPGGGGHSRAAAVSGDGSVIAGTSDSHDLGAQTFRWTLDSGMVPIGEFEMVAIGMSDDGSTIVGGSQALGALMWDAEHGIRDIKAVLEGDFGLDLEGWALTSAYGVSADGTVIVGWGVNPLGFEEGWVASVPEPGVMLLLAVGVLAMQYRRFVRH